MDDLISRQEATTIPVMPVEHREYQTMNLDDAYEQGWFDCQKSIEELPSAQRTGEWIQKANIYGVAYCSECDYELHTNDTNFCPNCGADMRGAQE